MKKFTLQLLNAIFTGKNYHPMAALKTAFFVILLCGISNMGFAVVYTTINVTTPAPIAAANMCQGAIDVNISAFTLTGTTVGAANTMTQYVFPILGTSTTTVPADIIQYKLWKNAGGGAGILLATSTNNVFSGLSESFTNGTTVNYWVTADVAPGATAGRFIQVANNTSGDVTATGGGPSVTNGATVGSGAQTVRDLPTVASLSALPTPICGGATLTLTAGAVTGTGAPTYNWTGPGGYSTTSPTSPKTYITPTAGFTGVFTVTVTYPGAGCTSTQRQSATVTVNPQPVLPATMYICNNVPIAGTTLNSGVAGGVWSSSNSSNATVNPATGTVWPTVVGGTSVITQVVTGGCSASTTITVAIRPSAIHGPVGIGGSTQAVCTGKTITLSSATVGGVWSSSFLSIASVTNGAPTNVTTVTGGAIAPGSGAATIIYTNPVTGCDTTITVNVNPTPFNITGPAVVCQGSTITLNDITPLGTWGSSAILTATVTPGPGAGGGVVYGVAAGGPINITYTVIATGCFVTKPITVNPLPAPITGNNIVCTALTTTVSDITPGGTWSSTVLPVASVASPTNPTVIAGLPGFTNIVYTLAATGCNVSYLMQVNQQPGPIGGPNVVCAGYTITLSDAVGGGTWASLTSAIAVVNNSTLGVVYGQYSSTVPQVATISYDLTSCIAVSYTVTVNPAPGPITGVQNVCIGFTTVLSDTTAGGIWSNSDLTHIVDSFTTAPTVRGISAGFSTITYTLPSYGCYDTAILIVYPNPDSIRDAMGRVVHFDSVCQGATVTLVDSTTGGTWSSTVLSIAQVVDSSGVVSGISAGNVNISYTLATGCYTYIPFRVKPIVTPAVSISYSPGGPLCQGTPETFTANPVNGGIPTYQWYLFTSAIPGAINQIYSYTPANGDLLHVQMITHFACTALDTLVVDTLIADVFPVNSGPVVNITSVPSSTTATYIGEVFTFFANVTWGGLSPAYQWYMNGTLIPGATLSSYSTPVYKDDSFQCQVTGTTPCNPVSTVGISNRIIIYASYLGVEPLSVATSDLVLFPNPSNGNMVLSGTVNVNSHSDINIEVIDMLGRNVYSGKTTPRNGAVREQINLGNIPAGAYMLHVNSEALNQVFRFVISK